MSFREGLANINQLWFHKVMPYYLYPALSRSSSVLLFAALLLLGGCDSGISTSNAGSVEEADASDLPTAGADSLPSGTTGERSQSQRLTVTESVNADDNVRQPRFNVDGDKYIIDVSRHTREELLAFFKRADEVITLAAPDFKKPDIKLILHGEDIDWFTKHNYEQNKELVDLAARLDALEIIDLKISEKAMQDQGYAEEDIPGFIERVPFGPDEIQHSQDSESFKL